ncbi:TPA: hypothetical protein ACGPA6_000188 [Streptococcus suis]
MKIKARIFIKKLPKITFFLLSCFLIIGCSGQESEVKEEIYRSLTAEYEIEGYQFVADGNGIIIDWKVTNQDDLDRNGRIYNDTAIATSRDFLVREVLRAKNGYDFLTRDHTDKEYFYLDVYDLRTSNLEKKRIDLWEVTQAYLKDEHYTLMGIWYAPYSLFREGETTYALISIGEGEDLDAERVLTLILNLETGVIEGEMSENELPITNREYLGVDVNQEEEHQVGFLSDGTTKLDGYDGSINLKEMEPSAFKVFNEEGAEAYRLWDIEARTLRNPEMIYKAWELFLDTGTHFYDVAVLSYRLDSTINGELKSEWIKNRITRFEDIATYAQVYKENTE